MSINIHSIIEASGNSQIKVHQGYEHSQYICCVVKELNVVGLYNVSIEYNAVNIPVAVVSCSIERRATREIPAATNAMSSNKNIFKHSPHSEFPNVRL